MRKYNTRRFKVRKSKSKFSQTEKLAYSMGQIARGLKNPNSKVYESYQNGLTDRKSKSKKTMF